MKATVLVQSAQNASRGGPLYQLDRLCDDREQAIEWIEACCAADEYEDRNNVFTPYAEREKVVAAWFTSDTSQHVRKYS